MKSKKSFDKLRGGYYTPQAITEFICKWIINKNTKNCIVTYFQKTINQWIKKDKNVTDLKSVKYFCIYPLL